MAPCCTGGRKTITAHIEMDSQLGTTKIEDDTDADARVVIDGLQDDPDQNAPGAGFTYSWSLITTGIPATLPDVDAATNTLSTSFDTAGEYHIQFKVDIDFVPGTGDDTWHGTATKSISQKVIGGSIIGGNTALSFCSDISPRVPVLSAASGQPPGTTYEWTIIQGSTRLKFVGATNEDEVTCQGTAGSNPANMYDVSVQLVYSLNGVTYSRSHLIKVLEPTELDLMGTTPAGTIYYPNDPSGNTKWHGFHDEPQTRTYELWDQTGVPMPGITLNEVWDNLDPNYSVFNGPAPHGFETGAQGQFRDYFAFWGFQPSGLSLNRPNSVLMGTLRQRIWAGSATQQIGCGPLINAPNVQWYTNGVTGW